MRNFRNFRSLGFAVVGVSAVACVGGTEHGAPPEAASETAGAALSRIAVRAFVEPLPIPQIVMAPKNGSTELTIRMCEFRSNVLPSTFEPSVGTYRGTWTWGYVANGPCPDKAGPARSTYIGPIILARRGTPTRVRYVNELGTTATSRVIAYTTSTDQTLHWADPLGGGANACAQAVATNESPRPDCARNYDGPIPAVPHLHGGEVPPQVDGAPDAWFTPDGRHGSSYYSRAGARHNEAIYTYPNTQEASPAWFHDHTLGTTRLNVYAGLAGVYLITDPNLHREPPGSLADPTGIVPLVVQDRMFDANGQLKMPNEGDTPEHPFWVDAFVGNVAVVNGKAMPYMNVEPRRYRFLVINGSNARTYDMALVDPITGAERLPIWQIGTDGGYLDRPVKIGATASSGLHRLSLMPGERADVIVDFGDLPDGATVVLNNDAGSPNGGPPDLPRLMEFRVTCGATRCPGEDTSFDPSTGAELRRWHPLVRLATAGAPAPALTVAKTRLLTLKEVKGVHGTSEILVNNTRFDGMSPRPHGDFENVTVNGTMVAYSELPKEGQTELWEIVNLTVKPHPLHLHLAHFQVLNRQPLNTFGYEAVYAASFPGGTVQAGFGPPLDYRAAMNSRSGGKDGGNPDVEPHLMGPAMPPDANEVGWKDTARVTPGQVTRLLVRWAPTDKSLTAPDLYYPFHPNGGRGYVWHCHILDHEDNQMMRPLGIVPSSAAPTPRPFTTR